MMLDLYPKKYSDILKACHYFVTPKNEKICENDFKIKFVKICII